MQKLSHPHWDRSCGFGPDRRKQDVSKLLDAFIASRQCDDALKALPLFVSEDGRSHNLHASEN